MDKDQSFGQADEIDAAVESILEFLHADEDPGPGGQVLTGPSDKPSPIKTSAPHEGKQQETFTSIWEENTCHLKATFQNVSLHSVAIETADSHFNEFDSLGDSRSSDQETIAATVNPELLKQTDGTQPATIWQQTHPLCTVVSTSVSNSVHCLGTDLLQNSLITTSQSNNSNFLGDIGPTLTDKEQILHNRVRDLTDSLDGSCLSLDNSCTSLDNLCTSLDPQKHCLVQRNTDCGAQNESKLGQGFQNKIGIPIVQNCDQLVFSCHEGKTQGKIEENNLIQPAKLYDQTGNEITVVASVPLTNACFVQKTVCEPMTTNCESEDEISISETREVGNKILRPKSRIFIPNIQQESFNASEPCPRSRAPETVPISRSDSPQTYASGLYLKPRQQLQKGQQEKAISVIPSPRNSIQQSCVPELIHGSPSSDSNNARDTITHKQNSNHASSVQAAPKDNQQAILKAPGTCNLESCLTEIPCFTELEPVNMELFQLQDMPTNSDMIDVSNGIDNSRRKPNKSKRRSKSKLVKPAETNDIEMEMPVSKKKKCKEKVIYYADDDTDNSGLDSGEEYDPEIESLISVSEETSLNKDDSLHLLNGVVHALEAEPMIHNLSDVSLSNYQTVMVESPFGAVLVPQDENIEYTELKTVNFDNLERHDSSYDLQHYDAEDDTSDLMTTASIPEFVQNNHGSFKKEEADFTDSKSDFPQNEEHGSFKKEEADPNLDTISPKLDNLDNLDTDNLDTDSVSPMECESTEKVKLKREDTHKHRPNKESHTKYSTKYQQYLNSVKEAVKRGKKIKHKLSNLILKPKSLNKVKSKCRYCGEESEIDTTLQNSGDFYIITMCDECVVKPKYTDSEGKVLTWKQYKKSLACRVSSSETDETSESKSKGENDEEFLVVSPKRTERKSNGENSSGHDFEATDSISDIDEEDDSEIPSDNSTSDVSDDESPLENQIIQATPVEKTFLPDSKKKGDLEHEASTNEINDILETSLFPKCDQCMYYPKSFKDLYFHKWFEHKEDSCQVCETTFAFPEQFYIHLKLHALCEIKECSICGSKFDFLPWHMIQAHNIKCCVLCGHGHSIRLQRAIDHMGHHKQIKFNRTAGLICPKSKCGFKICSVDFFLHHLWLYHDEKQCPSCKDENKFDSLNDLLAHFAKEHFTETKSITDKVERALSFVKTEYELKTLMTKVRIIPPILPQSAKNTDPGNEMVFKCGVCGWKALNSLALAKHKWVIHKRNSCECCDDTFLIPHQIATHSTLKTVQENKCWLCLSQYEDTEGLANHLQMEHNYSKCPFCSVMCKTTDELLKHLNLHKKVSKNINNCPYVSCYYVTKGIKELATHMFRVHGELQCLICSETCLSLSHLIMHAKMHMFSLEKQHIKEQNLSEKCPKCDFKTDDAELISAHLWNDHGLRICYLCHRLCNNSINNFINHNLHHKIKLKRECLMCGADCWSTAKLKVHLKQTHQIPRIYFLHCQHCPATCSSMKTFKSHWKKKHVEKRIVHEPQYTQSCDQCGKVYQSKSSLYVHMQQAHKPKNNLCDICGMVFSSYSLKQIHIRTHNGYKPYKCTLCDKTFARSDNLNTHMRIHTGEKPYVCDGCGKRFARGDNLKTHKKKMHS